MMQGAEADLATLGFRATAMCRRAALELSRLAGPDAGTHIRLQLRRAAKRVSGAMLPGSSHRQRRQFSASTCGARQGLLGQSRAHPARPQPQVFWRAWADRFCLCTSRQLYRKLVEQAAANGVRARDLRALAAAELLLCGAVIRRCRCARAGAAVIGITSAYYLFSAAPYVLTLAIMIATCSTRRNLAAAPGELSVTR